MADLSPDQASFLLHASLLPHIISEHATTKAVVSVVPAERMTYRPDAISRNAFELAWHIVAAEIKYLRAAGSGVFPFAPTPRPRCRGDAH